MTNEKNEPIAAALGVSVVNQDLFALAGDHAPTMTTQFLLASENLNPEDLENADFYLSDDKSAAVPPAVALDLLLGTQGWRRFADNTRPQNPETSPDENRAGRPEDFSGQRAPPIMYDNLARIREDYQKKLAAYYADRTQVLYTVVTISFLGAWGLLLLILMLGLLKIVRGAAFWLPVLGMIVSCSIIEALLVNPLRFAGENDQAVPFMSYPPPDQRVPAAQPVPPPDQRSATGSASAAARRPARPVSTT